MYEVGKFYSVEMPGGEISWEGKSKIVGMLTSVDLSASDWQAINQGKVGGLAPLPNDWAWNWQVVGKGEYVGTFTKRLSKFYHKVHGVKCPPSFLQFVGQVAREHSSESETFTVHFVDTFDWEPGDYGDGGSCWFGGRSEARELLAANNGGAMLVEEPNRARAWVVANLPHEGVMVLFNGYGMEGDATLILARIAAHMLGLSYKRVEVLNNGTGGGTVFINSDRGYVIGDTESIDRLHSVDLNFGGNSCYSCGDAIDADDDYVGDGEYYCRDCYYETFTTCESCDRTIYSDDGYYADDSTLCERCINRYYVSCADCGEYVHINNAMTNDDGTYCEDCFVEPEEPEAEEPEEE